MEKNYETKHDNEKDAHKLAEKEEEKKLKSESNFMLDLENIAVLMEKYEQRKTDEELIFLEEVMGGDAVIANKLKTDFVNGISDNPEEIEMRIHSFGKNELEQEEMRGCCEFVWEALGDLMLRILIVAAIVQSVLGGTVSHNPSIDWIEGLSIIIAVTIVITVGSVTNYEKEKKFKQLNDTNSDMIKYVITRDGKSREVNSGEILVGDIVTMNLGMILPADGIVISGSDIKMDESPLTGESDLIIKESTLNCLAKKKEILVKGGEITNKHSLPSPVVYSGTMMNAGKGAYMVLAVGENSLKGKIRRLVQQSQESDDSKTPLEEKLDSIAEQVGWFGLSAAFVTFIALIIRFGVAYASESETYMQSNQTAYLVQAYITTNVSSLNSTIMFNHAYPKLDIPQNKIGGDILNIILLCVAIIVVSIPEGLPLAVTLAMAFSINKMMKENNLVRKMQACETMGGANYICSDKTGTLTRNIMSVVSIFDGKETLDTEEDSKADNIIVNPSKYFKNSNYYKLFKLSIILNIDATIDAGEIITKSNRSDKGFIDILHIFGEKLYDIRASYLTGKPRGFPFSSDRKRMSQLVKNSEFPTGYRIFIKGASEILLNWVTHYTDPETCEKTTLPDASIELLKGVIKGFANRTLRTILICYKDLTEQEYDNYQELDNDGDYVIEKNNLTLISIVGIKDTLRLGVPEAVAKCNRAGITVLMVTGDNRDTAIAIAKQCNIIDKESTVEGSNIALNGEDFYSRIGGLSCKVCNKKSEKCDCPKTKKQAEKQGKDETQIKKDVITNMDEFSKIVKDLRVLARSRPIDKYTLVLGLKKLKNVVAVTGDGTNDAPALSKSDVGFAMGIQGTDIAKEASDIIILDDNFASIVTAVLWGRNIYDNIRKFLQFQLTVNVCACLLVFITACIGNETPLTAIQMLWVNLIMDSLGSLALATEPPNDYLLMRKPYKRSERIINLKMWKHILISSIFLLGLLLFLYMFAPNFITEDDPYRIAESRVIEYCYGYVPAKKPIINPDGTKTYYIINGSSSAWTSNYHLLPLLTELDCGNYAKQQDLSVAFTEFRGANGSSAHMTVIFNTFVFYTLFNQINSRVIDDTLNIFYRIEKNLLFILITIAEMGLQAMFIEIGANVFNISRGGLTGAQWGICIGFGAISFLVSALIKFLPIDNWIEWCLADSKNKIANINDVEESAKEDKPLEPGEENKQPNLKKQGSGLAKKSTLSGYIVKSRSRQLSVQLSKGSAVNNFRTVGKDA